MFDVRVLWNGRDVTGSPFHPRVVDASRVRPAAGWPALVDAAGRLVLQAGQAKKIAFDTLDAGPGSPLIHSLSTARTERRCAFSKEKDEGHWF